MTDTDREQILYDTIDPENVVDGRPVPALTTLLYRVCGEDPERFEEATRLVELFIIAALSRSDARMAEARAEGIEAAAKELERRPTLFASDHNRREVIDIIRALSSGRGE